MQFVHVNLRVRDIDASLRFYEALGFERRGRLQFEAAYNVYLGLPIIREMGAGVRTEALPIYDYATFADDLAQGAHGP